MSKKEIWSSNGNLLEKAGFRVNGADKGQTCYTIPEIYKKNRDHA